MSHVRIIVTDEGQVSVSGAGISLERQAGSADRARVVALAAAADRAEALGTPVVVEASGPDGSHWLEVGADRSVRPAPRQQGSTTPDDVVCAPPPPVSDIGQAPGAGQAPDAVEPDQVAEPDPFSTSLLEEARVHVDRPQEHAEGRRAQRRAQRRRLRDRLRPGRERSKARAAQAVADAMEEIRAGLVGRRVITVLGTKGGAGKTPSAIQLAGTLSRARGGGVLVVCLNPAQGTLGERGFPAAHGRTIADLLEDLDRFETGRGSAGDLDGYVWPQPGHFDLLASETREVHRNPRTAEHVKRLIDVLTRYYRVVVIDTGNDMGTELWQACVTVADRLLLVSRLGEDQTKVLADMAASMRDGGNGQALAEAVTVLMPGEADAAREASADGPSAARRAEESARLHAAAHEHFSALTASVIHAPFEPAIANGRRIRVDALSEATRRTWVEVARDLTTPSGGDG